MGVGLLRRSTFGLPKPRGRCGFGSAALVWAVAVIVLAGATLVLRAIRWADRNL